MFLAYQKHPNMLISQPAVDGCVVEVIRDSTLAETGSVKSELKEARFFYFPYDGSSEFLTIHLVDWYDYVIGTISNILVFVKSLVCCCEIIDSLFLLL
jgi:hypothetical protein